MTTPDTPLRFDIEVEIAGTPEQVWQAIATAEGISSWFLPTDLDGREGGALVTHMGDTSSPGRVTGWDPPRRFVYEEPEWAAMVGHPEADVTPLTNEFLVEARSGGTCVVRVTSSAFGTGADWEHEFLDDMATYYEPFFDFLRLYVERFPGQRATRREVDIRFPGEPGAVIPAAARSLGVAAPGDVVPADAGLGVGGTVMRVADPYLMVDVDGPVPGYVHVLATQADEGVASAQVSAWLFGPGAEEVADAAAEGWRPWLDSLGLAAGTAAAGTAGDGGAR